MFILLLMVTFIISLQETHSETYDNIFQGFDMAELVDTPTPDYNNEYTISEISSTSTSQRKSFNFTVPSNITFTPVPHDIVSTTSVHIKKQEGIKRKKANKCPEEHPYNIGPFEVPTQRDLVQFLRKTIANMFNAYHTKALLFLKDIKEATKATSDIENICIGPSKMSYKECVKFVSRESEFLTKRIVTTLESMRNEVDSFDEETLCDAPITQGDPIQLAKILAMEEVSLNFALPGFLRLLNSCSSLCTRSYSQMNIKSLLRRTKDQDLLIKHLFTQKDYLKTFKKV